MTATSVPPLDPIADLPADVVRGFAVHGHAVVRGLASPEEVATFRPAIEAAVQRVAPHMGALEARDTYGKAFLQVPNICMYDDVVRGFTFASRFAKVAAELLQVDGVRLYHDQALFKEPGGGHTPGHQDQNYWPLATDRTITMWMPLVDVPEDVGSMTFVDGSHLRKAMGDWIIGDESEAEYEAMRQREGLRTTTYGAMRAGDATFHAGWTLHRAPANHSDSMRAVMTIIYYADGTRISPIEAPQQAFDQQIWLAGAEPGTLADGPGNPLLWPV